MESEACGVWTPCEVKMKKVQRKKQPRRRSSMITHLKKQEIVVQKKKTKEIACGNESIYHTIQDLKTQPYSIGILTQEAYRRSTYWKAK